MLIKGDRFFHGHGLWTRRTVIITLTILLLLLPSFSNAEERFETVTLSLTSDIACCPLYFYSVRRVLKETEGIKNFYTMSEKERLVVAYYPEKISKEKIIKIVKNTKGMRFVEVQEVVNNE